jgi:hypothetical protein
MRNDPYLLRDVVLVLGVWLAAATLFLLLWEGLAKLGRWAAWRGARRRHR